MKHKHYDMIVAKAENMDLVVFIKCQEKWKEQQCNDDQLNFSCGHDYFLCLPQHKETCLHWLNGGYVEYSLDYKSQWFVYQADEDRGWSEESAFNSDDYDFRIKPKKEKRWIAVNSNGGVVPKTFGCENGAKFWVDHNSEKCQDYWQFIEIEVEI